MGDAAVNALPHDQVGMVASVEPRLRTAMELLQRRCAKAGWGTFDALGWALMMGPTIAYHAVDKLNAQFDYMRRVNKGTALPVGGWAPWMLAWPALGSYSLADVTIVPTTEPDATIWSEAGVNGADFGDDIGRPKRIASALYKDYPHSVSRFRSALSTAILAHHGLYPCTRTTVMMVREELKVCIRVFEPEQGDLDC